MLQRKMGRITCDIVWHWHKEAPPPAFQAQGVEFSAGCSLRCQLLCHWGWKIFSCSWFGIKSLILAFTCWGPSWWHSDHSGFPQESESSGCPGSGWLAGCAPGIRSSHWFANPSIAILSLVNIQNNFTLSLTGSWASFGSKRNIMLTCLLRLSLVFNLNRLINKSLSVSCLDNLRLALACCCLLEVDLMCMNFNLFPGGIFSLKISTCCWSTMCCPAWPPTLPSTWKASWDFRQYEEKVEYIKIDERIHSGTISWCRLAYLTFRTWRGLDIY